MLSGKTPEVGLEPTRSGVTDSCDEAVMGEQDDACGEDHVGGIQTCIHDGWGFSDAAQKVDSTSRQVETGRLPEAPADRFTPRPSHKFAVQNRHRLPSEIYALTADADPDHSPPA